MDHIPAKITVLAVDDDAEFCRIITHYLTEDTRYLVITADSGKKALEILKNQQISAVIADYQMPELDGLDLLRILRADGNEIPFVIFTGQGCEEVAIQALNEGADFYFIKGEDPGPQFLVLRKNLREIIEKKQADEALRISESENRRTLSLLRATLEATEDGILVETNEGTIVGYNERLLQLLNLQKNQLDGAVREKLCSSLRQQMTGPAIQVEGPVESSLKKDEIPHNILSFHDGRVIETYSRPQICEGKMVGKVWSYHDLTDRIKAEEALKESREKFRILFEYSPISHQVLDEEGKILEVNQAWVAMLGHTKSEIIGKYFTSLGDPSCQASISSCITSIKCGELVKSQELILYHKDGRPLTTIVDGLAVKGHNGTILQIQCTLRDITEVRKTEKRLLWTESLLAQIVDLLPFGICVTTEKNSEIIYRNNRFNELWGLNHEVSSGKNLETLEKFLSACSVEPAPDIISESLFFSETRIRCEEITLPDKTVLRSYQRLFSDSEGGNRQLWAFEDISLFKSQEYEIRQYTRRLEILGKVISLSSRASQIKSLCDLTLQSIIPLMNFDGGCIHLFSDDRQTGVLITCSGIIDSIITRITTIPANSFPDSVKLGQSLFTDLVPDLFSDLMDNKTIGSIAFIPIIGRGIIIGILSLFYHRVSEVLSEEKIMLNGIGREIGGAVIRIQDQDALRNARKNLDNLVNSITDMVFVIDAGTGSILEINEAVLRRLGYCREDLIGRSVLTPMVMGIPLFPPELFHDISVVREHTLPVADGTLIQVETSTATGSWNVRNVRFYVARDISESIAAQELIRRNEERLRALFESSPIGIILYDSEGYLVDLNSAVLTILGSPDKKSLSGIPLFSLPGVKEETIITNQDEKSLIFEYVLDFTNDAIVRLFSSQKTDPIEIRLIITPLKVGGDGENSGYLVLIEDITTERQMLRMLRESEAFNRGLITHLPDYILVYNPEGRIMYVNPSGLSAIRADASEVIGGSIYDYVNPKQKDLIETQIRKRLKGEEVTPNEIQLIRSDKTGVDVMVQAIKIPYHGSDAVLTVLTDITSRKDAEQALENYTQILQKTVNALAAANKKLNLLSDVTRHDILNQVHLIFNYLDLVESESFSDSSLGYLKKIEESTSVIHRQIEFTRSYQDLGVNAPEWQELSVIIDNLDNPGIILINKTQGFMVHADPLLPKVFENLLDNSIRHGRKTTEIIVTILPDDQESILVSWADNGAGVSEKEKTKIFEKGYGKNTGFGLFLIREILGLTGITIEETGTYGTGAHFKLHVPKGSFRSIL